MDAKFSIEFTLKWATISDMIDFILFPRVAKECDSTCICILKQYKELTINAKYNLGQQILFIYAKNLFLRTTIDLMRKIVF